MYTMYELISRNFLWCELISRNFFVLFSFRFGWNLGSLFVTRIRRCYIVFSCGISKYHLSSFCSDQTSYQRIFGKSVAKIWSCLIYCFQKSVCWQTFEFVGPSTKMDQVQAFSRALRLCQWQLHQRLKHLRQRFVKNCNHWQFTTGKQASFQKILVTG